MCQGLPTIRHFENRRGEGPGDEVGESVIFFLCISREFHDICEANIRGLGPVRTYPGIFEYATFLSVYGYRPHASGEFDSESGYFYIALQSGDKEIRNEFDNVWTGESGYFRI